MAPLFVDLDHTLVATDTLHEGLLILIKQSPWALLRLVGWLLQGRAGLKRRLAELGTIPDVTVLPYRDDVMAFLHDQKALGRTLILVTASDELVANRIADHLGLFHEVLGSDGVVNLKGTAKLEAIEESCKQRGWASFAYMGDSRADLPIWSRAAELYAVDPARSVLARLSSDWPPERVFSRHSGPIRALLKAVRPHQWVKNLLVFLPLLLAHEWGDLSKVVSAIWAFMAFSLAASSAYLTNDLLDLESDRHHPTKRHRPFASGAVI